MIFLGILDVLVAAMIFFGLLKSLFLIFGIIWFVKGLWSVGSAAAGGFMFDILGWLDIAAGASLLIVLAGIEWSGFVFIAVLLFIKGVYSILMGISS